MHVVANELKSHPYQRQWLCSITQLRHTFQINLPALCLHCANEKNVIRHLALQGLSH